MTEQMPHARKVLAYTFAFFVAVASLVGLASGRWHLGLEAGIYASLAFGLWLEARYSCG